jgi:hypothetical protein
LDHVAAGDVVDDHFHAIGFGLQPGGKGRDTL